MSKSSNCQFNADANTGDGFAIFMARVGALRASRSGASYPRLLSLLYAADCRCLMRVSVGFDAKTHLPSLFLNAEG